jgi:hypothetical protein
LEFRRYSEFTLLLILCTSALFFFPVAHGSYSAVHGPATALRSIHSRLRMWFILALAAWSPLFGRLSITGSRLLCRPHVELGLFSSGLERISVLRC